MPVGACVSSRKADMATLATTVQIRRLATQCAAQQHRALDRVAPHNRWTHDAPDRQPGDHSLTEIED
jgi:hypothetical protein